MSDDNNPEEPQEEEVLDNTVLQEEDLSGSHLNRMMTLNFLEFASYVIKDRAIPDVDDGLKPVQRRILHTQKRVDDGKYHKVANVVGDCMKFHPHGDSSIYGALVNIANKDFFIDKQGNFGNILTGDNASAARYIECRLTPLARETLFNKETTEFVDSYDGRNQEPVVLPAKLPVLLMQGAEGIAVGMATKVLSHNFNELLKAQIDILRGKRIRLYPDFPQGGFMDVSEYDDGAGKVKVRAKLEKLNKNTLIIREVAPGTTTESLMQSIQDANKNGKIKLSAINDYTSEHVEIELKLTRGADADRTEEALYAFTNCEVSLSSNVTVIKDNIPVIMTVPQILHHNTQKLVDILRWELEIELSKLNERFHEKTLEQIFIENRIYKRIEECKEEEEVYKAVFAGLEPFKDMLKREVTREDIDRLLRIPIRRISLFDMNKNRKELDDILKAIEEVKHNLAHLKDFTIDFIKDILKRYGKDYPRRTVIQELEQVNAKEVALANTKVGIDRKGGYVGKSVSGADSMKCTEYDRIVVLHRDGKFKVMNIPDKTFVGRFYDAFIVDKDQVYSIIYRDNKNKICYHKRCKIDRFILEKEYQICPPKCKIELFDKHYGIVLECELEDTARSKGQTAELQFEDIPIRGTTAKGFKTANRPISKFTRTKRGTEKKPQEGDVQEDNFEDEEAEAKKREWGWKSKDPIRFTAPEFIEKVEVEGLTEEEKREIYYVPEGKREAVENARKIKAEEDTEESTAAKAEKEEGAEVDTEKEEESTVAKAKKDEGAEVHAEKEEESTVAKAKKDEENTEKKSTVAKAEKEEGAEKEEDKAKTKTKAKATKTDSSTEKSDTQKSSAEKSKISKNSTEAEDIAEPADQNEEAEPKETEVDENGQAILDLPEEKGKRRYLIDEDNPFKLE